MTGSHRSKGRLYDAPTPGASLERSGVKPGIISNIILSYIWHYSVSTNIGGPFLVVPRIGILNNIRVYIGAPISGSYPVGLATLEAPTVGNFVNRTKSKGQGDVKVPCIHVHGQAVMAYGSRSYEKSREVVAEEATLERRKLRRLSDHEVEANHWV